MCECVPGLPNVEFVTKCTCDTIYYITLFVVYSVVYWCLCVAIWIPNKFHLSDVCVVHVVCAPVGCSWCDGRQCCTDEYVFEVFIFSESCYKAVGFEGCV